MNSYLTRCLLSLFFLNFTITQSFADSGGMGYIGAGDSSSSSKSNTQSTSSSSQNASSTIQLPSVQLPTVNGKAPSDSSSDTSSSSSSTTQATSNSNSNNNSSSEASSNSTPSKTTDSSKKNSSETINSDVKPAVIFKAQSQAGGSVAGVSNNVQSASVQVEPSTGTASLSIPITVPPGRASIQPNLAVVYSSTSHQIGNAGVGWSLDLGSIQISTKKGIPRYDGTDIFTMESNGGTEDLVEDPNTSGLYHMEVEGSFAQIQFINSSYWIITDKKGTKYYYGNSSDSIQADPNNSSHVFRWALNRVEDINGNYMTISYLNDQGQIYPETISYTGNYQSSPNLSPYAQVNIIYAGATIPTVSYISGFQVVTAQRINQITVAVGLNTQTTYNFNYIQSSVTGRDLLQSVQQVGFDGTTALPAVTFNYNTTIPNYTLNSSVSQSLQKGDNLWNYAYNGGYDRGNDNYGPVPCFDVQLGPTYTQQSGSWSNASWSIDPYGLLSFSSRQDTANEFWTYLYVKNAKTITVPMNGDGDLGSYVNLDSCSAQSNGTQWPLNAGWNVVVITSYNQNQSYSATIGGEISTMVDVMNSKQLDLPQFPADFNGDGLTDMGNFVASTGTFNVELNNGSGFASQNAWITGFGINQNIITGDFNGDGKTDIAYYDTTAGQVHVALSNGTAFTDNGVWLNTSSSGIPSTVTVLAGQFTGSSFTDLVFVYKDGSGNWKGQIAKNIGNSFVLTGTVYSLQLGPSTSTVLSGNFTGSGLTDLIGFDTSTGTWSVHLNTNGFNNTGYYSITGFGANHVPVIGDFDGEGQDGIGYYDPSQGTVVYKSSILNGFGNQQQLNFTSSIQANDTEAGTGNFSGNSPYDYVIFDSVGEREVFTSPATVTPFDVLTSINNGIGAQTNITYDSNLRYGNTYMPYYIPVIKSTTTTVTTPNGSQNYTTTYSYNGGLWDTTWEEYDGFQSSTVTDPNGNYAITNYDIAQGGTQNHWLKEHPLEVDTYGAPTGCTAVSTGSCAAVLYSKSGSTWVTQTIATNNNFTYNGQSQVSVFPYASRNDKYLYDGNSSFKRTAQEFTFGENPQYGDVTQIINDGQVDPNSGISIDPNKIITQTNYVSNTNNWIIGLPTIALTYNANNNQIGKVSFYYDGDTTGSAKPSFGHLTKKVNWLGSSTQVDPATKYTYDQYGNLLTTTDPNGNTTSITYDNTAHMLPEQTTNALGQAVLTTYYGIDGVSQDSDQGYEGLWGQQASVTDANNATTYTIYDALGRMTATISPLDSVAFPTTQKSYNIQSNYIQVVGSARTVAGQSQTISKSSFYDGLGRLIETKSLGPNAGQYIASDITVYDNRGLPIKKYLSSFTNNDLNTLDLVDTTNNVFTNNSLNAATLPFSQQVYDAMGRATSRINPDNTYSSTIYNQWTTTTIDENGHEQVSIMDAFGQLIQKQEFLGADGRSPSYPASAFTIYTTTNYTYNPQGDLIKLTDTKNNVTAMSYDNLGRKIGMNDPDMGVCKYGYDNNGNLIWQEDAKGQVINFTYDALNRLINKTDAVDQTLANQLGIPATSATFNVDYNFDDPVQLYGIGRLGSVDYDSGMVSFMYDPLGNEVSLTKNIAHLAYNVTHQYDDLNRLTQLQYPDGFQLNYNYNQAGQLQSISGQ